MEKKIFKGATLEDAITEATLQMGITSEKLGYNVIQEGAKGFLGIGSKEAEIEAWVKTKDEIAKEKEAAKESPKEEKTEKKAEKKEKTTANDEAHFEEGKKFLEDIFSKMGMTVAVTYEMTDEDTLAINLAGEDMGILIGKRGQTLDSLQYLTSLVINKSGEHFVRVKLDTENYRERRKETLESVAKNTAYKVKRTRKSIALEPMNPYERRIIHSYLQSDNFVMTKSEGEGSYRHVVVFYKRNKNGEER